MNDPIQASNGVTHPAGEVVTGAEWNQIRDAVRGLRFGTVSIIIQDGVVVQIDRLEKRRIRRSEAGTTLSARHTP